MERLSSDFFELVDGPRTVAERAEVVDDIVRSRFGEVFSDHEAGVAAIAVGGYGRAELFPHSDIDLLLLFRKAREAHGRSDDISRLLAMLWDSKLRVSHSVRDPAECSSLAPNNTELHISLLDTRFLTGDETLYQGFRHDTLPRFFLREQKALIRSLAESAQKRHQKFEGTVYHLEPNIKEGPGGLRDYQLACWTTQLENVERSRVPTSEEHLPTASGWSIADAKRFMFAIRCFLHYYHGRDKNILTYDMQDSIATAGAGRLYPGEGDVSDMMRIFFRNSRSVNRLALRLIDESTARTSALQNIFRKRKSRLSNSNFVVANGKVFFRDSQVVERRPDLVMSLFAFVSRHGLPLAPETQRRISERGAEIRSHFAQEGRQWEPLREILELPNAYAALESMRETGVLSALFPEFDLVDSLVIRDFYHRYTVDEHTLMTIRILKDLYQASKASDQRFARLLEDVERTDLLAFSLLFHDIGKGTDNDSHSEASAILVEEAMRRIGLDDPTDCATVLFLVRDHLVMSSAMTRLDLGESAALDEFKRRVGTVERLKLLTLLTYADTIAVNPNAITDWRKDVLWRLYQATDAVFQRDHEDKRIGLGTEADCLDLAEDDLDRAHMVEFLKGFPQRYLTANPAERVREHYLLARGLAADSAFVRFHRGDGHLRIVVICPDRPGLFASLCAGLAGLGLDIEHAEAFANDSGMVLDSFRVSARSNEFLEDLERFEDRLRRTAEGRREPRVSRRMNSPSPPRWRGQAPPEASFDNTTSSRATIFYVRAPDRAGLLYSMASVFSNHRCDIDVVLCHTQGRRANDVFYVRLEGRKLSGNLCETVRKDLLRAVLSPSQTLRA